MREIGGIVKILLLFFLILFSLAYSCAPGEIYSNGKCIPCSRIRNAEPTNAILEEECLCILGFTWSVQHQACLPQNYQQPITTDLNHLPHIQDFGEKRLLASPTCDKTNGFILYQQTALNKSAPLLCTNCRILPYSYSAQLNSSACTCYPSFKFIVASSTFNNCYCYPPKYIDPYTSTCTPCASISSQLFTSCSKCSFPFTYGIFGCVYTLNLTNGGSLSTSTACATGFTFSFYSASCVCSYSGSYSIASNGVCTKCGTSDNNCKYCQKTYVYDGFQCKHGSLIPNYNITSFACNTGTTFKFHFFTNAIMACACSSAAKYYQNGASCVFCSTSLPNGVALIDCQSCSASAGFYLGSVECIYCPGVANSKGTATINGCDCAANYFWNMTSGQCECDFINGYIPANSTCISCNNIDNTDYIILPSACTCTKGYKWNPNTYNCDCDTRFNLSFILGGACVDCSTMMGSAGNVADDGKSCECISSFYWNPGLQKCMCDYDQNFAVFSNGLCTDCMEAPYANGLGNSFGCVCTNGMSWDSNTSKCLCPAGSVMIGTICKPCASATLPSGATSSDCTACLNSKGFVTQPLGCYACSSQNGASSTVTNGSCTCITQNQVWRPLVGSCSCDWTANYVSRIGTNSTSYKCSLCSWKWSDGSCACDVWFLMLDSTNQICLDASYDPHGSGSSTTFKCNTGYMWSQSSFPFQCVPGYSSGNGYFSSSNNSYIACSLASNPTACALCDMNQGYLFVSGTDICVLCSTVTRSTGQAVLNGCVCSSGSQWNPSAFTCDIITCTAGTLYNPLSKSCVCDPIQSVKINGICIYCVNISQSNGFANTTTSCGCNPQYSWFSQINGGGCFNPDSICNSTTQISYAGGCFNCPSLYGPGLANGNICQCNTNYVWNATANGGSCICDLSKAYTYNSSCLACPSMTQDPNSLGKGDGNGGCACLVTYVWIASASSGSCLLCSSAAGMVMLSNGSCFFCGTNGTYTTFKLVSTLNNTCLCSILTLQWSSDGYCDCGQGSAMVPSNSSFSCFVCSNASAFTTTKATSFSCNCIGNLIWNPTNRNCGCGNGSFLIGSGANAICFSCQIANSIGVFNQSSCQCAANFIWQGGVSGGSCVCDFAKSYMIGFACFPCPTSLQDPNSAGMGNGNGSCLCLGNSVWTTTNSSGSCVKCNSYNGIVALLNNSCFQCGTSGTFTKTKITTILNNTCTCSLSFLSWNTNGYCDCGDGKVMVPQGHSYSCYSCNNITGYTISKTSSFNCRCVSDTMIWAPINKVCRCSSKSIMKGSGYAAFCFACPTVNGKGKSKGSQCVCNTNYVWVSTTTGGRCECNFAKSYLKESACLPCPTSSQDPRSTGFGDGNGSCICTGNYVWVAANASCMLCTTPGSIQLNNGTCLVCGAPGSNTLSQFATSQNNSCSCVEGFIWNPLGLCDCGSTSILFTSAGSLNCYSCANETAFTSSKADPYSCTCVSQTMKWNPNTKTCFCPSNSILIGSGSSAYCFVCPTTGNFLGISADRSSCICAGSLVWNSVDMNCGCQNTSNIVVGSGFESQCVSCSSILYASTFVNATTCSCLGNGLIFNSSGTGSCKCPINNIISPIFTCVACPNGTVPLTPYECRCPLGSIWSYSAQNCLQCGSTLIPNSQASDSTNMACVCSPSYIWDVMTQSCILSSTCTGASSSCMTCPSGSALATNPSTVRNLRFGSIIQGFLSGSFTNYNQINGYQCPCSTSYLWDSIRLRCFASGLQ